MVSPLLRALDQVSFNFLISCELPNKRIKLGIGIGKSTAIAFAQQGVRGLALLDHNSQVLERTYSQLKTQFPNIEARKLEADVSDESSVKNAVNKTIQEFGKIDFAVNCAGVGCSHNQTHEMPLEEWQRVININQTGVWICQKSLIQQMLQQE